MHPCPLCQNPTLKFRERSVLSHETMLEHNNVIVLQRSLASAIHEIDVAR